MLQKISLGKTYWITFLILVLWSSFAFYTMSTLIESQKTYGQLINLSGKQRMLSQKTSLYAHLVLDKRKTTTDLKKLLDQMQQEYLFISTHLPSTSLQNFYFQEGQLNEQVLEYFHILEHFLFDPKQTQLDQVLTKSEHLLSSLHNAVNLFESEYRNVVKELEQREMFIYLGTLLTLILEAVIIILPMLKKHNNYLEELEKEVAKRTNQLKIFEKVFEKSNEGMIITDTNERIINVNKAFSTITGYSLQEVMNQTPRILHSGKHDPHFYQEMWYHIHTHHIWQGEVINQRKDGKELYENLTIIKLRDQNSFFYVSIFSDITERIFHEQQLHYMGNHDSLTGLFNRTAIIQQLSHAIELAQRLEKPIAVLYIDLDNFKLINDSMGHSIGDLLLFEVSKRLLNIIRKSDTLGRLGGDEFIIVIESLRQKGDEDRLLKNIRKEFQKPITIEKREFHISASIGVAYSCYTNKLQCSAQNLIRKADLAMYEAKSKGKNHIAYYNETMEAEIQSQLLVKQELQYALKNNEMQLYLQPKFDLKNARYIGAEALIRWNKDGEFISPVTFIPIAEENDLILELDLWVTKKAIEYLKELHKLENTNFTIAINISGRTFANFEAMETILDLITANNALQYIEIEITEGILVENHINTSRMVKKIKDKGITITLDDFGTGYSSFSYLSRIPFDIIKIDRSFIATLDEDKQAILVEAILLFSHKLGMKVVAEGIETEEQLSWLTQRNCEVAQGYLFSKPICFEDLKTLLHVTKSTE